ncbi:MAG TPA: TolC family protein [Hanamia sp.]|nr:TolC family protein [Hanamia sp.]
MNLVSLSVKSQDVKSLTLQETIDLSLKNSHILKASSAKIEEAIAQTKQAEDNKLPNASVSGSYLYLDNPNIDLKTKAFSGGGSDTSSSKGGFPKVNQAMYGIFNVSLPIYAGGKIRYGIESAKYLQQATMLDAANDKEGVILNTINAYINLYKAFVTVGVVKENLQQSEHRDSVFTRLEQNGLMARNDLLKAELQTSNISLSLLDAQSNLKIANVNMDLMIGYPETTVLKTDSTGFDKNLSLKTIDDYEQMALQNRNDIKALSFRRQAATTGISLAKADQYPTVALTGGYIAADVPHILSITNAINIGVGLQYNLSSLWKTKAKIQEAQSREKEVIENEAQLDDVVRLQVNQDFENLLLSQRKISVFEKAVAQAEENYRITKNKYDNALVNTTDLLDANVSLLQSKINLAVAKADVLLAYSKLLETTGTLSDNQ